MSKEHKQEMVEVPWFDGTTRLVPWGSFVRLLATDRVVMARPDMYYDPVRECLLPWGDKKAAAVLVEGDEPSQITKLPTNLGAVVAHYDKYVLTPKGWVSSAGFVKDSYVQSVLQSEGGQVLSKGVQS